MKQRQVYIGFGSNQGNSIEIIEESIRKISEDIGEIILKSSFYVTEPVGFEADTDFINAVVIFRSNLTPMEILNHLMKIEADLGRIRTQSRVYESRSIDLDILAIDQETVSLDNLEIPHPLMHQRAFVLMPFLEIDSIWLHPIEKQTVEVMAKNVKNKSKVRRISS
jgi:2-amino-4-hydroxy-6-hydroxymethyldihydropteridine diphosphokinase